MAQLCSFQGTWHSALTWGRRQDTLARRVGWRGKHRVSLLVSFRTSAGFSWKSGKRQAPQLSSGIRPEGCCPRPPHGYGGTGRLAQTHPAVSPSRRPEPFLESSFPLFLGVKYGAIALESVQFQPMREVKPPRLPSAQWPGGARAGRSPMPGAHGAEQPAGPGMTASVTVTDNATTANTSPGAGLLGCKGIPGAVTLSTTSRGAGARRPSPSSSLRRWRISQEG